MVFQNCINFLLSGNTAVFLFCLLVILLVWDYFDRPSKIKNAVRESCGAQEQPDPFHIISSKKDE